MRRNGIFSQALREVKRQSFSQAARIYKKQRRAVLLDEVGEAVVNFIPHFMRRHSRKFATRDFDSDVDGALMADLHDYRVGPGTSCQEMGNQLDWFLRGGQTDPDRRPVSKRFQSFE